MTVIRRTNPLGELISVRSAMDRLFEISGMHQLPLDIRTTEDSFVVEAALPGVKPDDVQVSLLGDQLTISASHRADQSREQGGYSYREIRRGSFTRTVTLPGNLRADDATASFDNGLLTLRIPRAEAARARQIPITPATETVNVPPVGETAEESPQEDQA